MTMRGLRFQAFRFLPMSLILFLPSLPFGRFSVLAGLGSSKTALTSFLSGEIIKNRISLYLSCLLTSKVTAMSKLNIEQKSHLRTALRQKMPIS